MHGWQRTQRHPVRGIGEQVSESAVGTSASVGLPGVGEPQRGGRPAGPRNDDGTELAAAASALQA
jgi:hypothetical protein